MADLFDKLVSFENIYSSYKDARQCKRYRNSILKFGYNLEENLLLLRWQLVNKTYKHGDYREFAVTDSKKRIIKAAPFRDRVVHHAICNIIEPIFERGFIFDSYACRKGKGTHKSVKRLEHFIRSIQISVCADKKKKDTKIYCLKCDISKYFDSVDHKILLNLLCDKISDQSVIWLLKEVIESNPRGIPIGNLTSQLFANIYLNKLDHFIKQDLREKYYIRYMDDFFILGSDKCRLRESKEQIKIFLRDELKLELHPKKAEISKIDRGIDFLGYVLKDKKRFLRRSTVKRFIKKKLRYKVMVANGKLTEMAFKNTIVSWRGYAGFANSYKLRQKLELNY